ncbi:MAG: UDP-N-acetylglucosamine 2-epimerase (non-hydrolyzing) [Planctomycetes bacterium]|nr:UDP-N-acetylglucosamine 2-epimerase (non-hydrolyzing) [Planctomycetota bacterium]
MLVFGTRPEAIKLAPVVFALRARPDDAHVVLCSTGQHRSMLDDALDAFDLHADIDLNVMRDEQHQTDLLARLLHGLRPVIDEQRPDAIIVQGDTASVFAASLAGFLAGVPVAHVEAGLRTRDRRSPFPEEIYRRLTGVTARLHFAPTPRARQNLLGEGVEPEQVFLTGNTIVDALESMRERSGAVPLPDGLGDCQRRMILVTAHRRESFGPDFREICLALREIVDTHQDVELVYPVHLNPNVQRPVHEILGQRERIHLLGPLPYKQFVRLLLRADLILTDSGGIQEEAPALGKPVLVLREKTERPEAIAAGVARLVGANRERIVAEAHTLLTNPDAYRQMARKTFVYGDGLAATRIAEVLIDGRMSTPPFDPTTSAASVI